MRRQVPRCFGPAPLLGLAMAVGVAAPVLAAPGGDPDWPCVQRLVPELTASSVWSGPPLPAGEAWRQVPEIGALVMRITPRAVEEAEGIREIRRFAETLDTAARRRLLPLVLIGMLEETNHARAALIERIKAFARRQRGLAETAQRISEQLGAIPAEATGEAGARRAELQQRHFFAAKTFQDAERTLRYMCEAPVRLEARFGAYARALEAALPEPAAH